MENVSNADKFESIKSLQSTIGKLEKALAQMTQKCANTTLVKKRLKAIHIGLAMLEKVWNQTPHQYTQEDLAEARTVKGGRVRTANPGLKRLESEERPFLQLRSPDTVFISTMKTVSFDPNLSFCHHPYYEDHFSNSHPRILSSSPP